MCSVKIIHGTADNIVPYDHGRKLYQRARLHIAIMCFIFRPECLNPRLPKEMLTVPGGDHNAVVIIRRDGYLKGLNAALNFRFTKPAWSITRI